MTDVLPSVITPRYFNSTSITLVSGTVSGTSIINVGSIPVGSLVVAVILGTPPSQGTGTRSTSPPRFMYNGTSQGDMTLVQPSTLSTGETVLHSGFMVGYNFIGSNPMANSSLFAVGYDAFQSGGGMSYATSMQVAVFDGCDPNGTIVTGHADNVTINGSMTTPSVTTTVSSSLLTIWASQDAGTILMGSNINTASFAAIVSTINSGDTTETATTRSTFYDIPPGTNTGTPVDAIATSLASSPRLRCAVLALPVQKSDSIGDLSTAGY